MKIAVNAIPFTRWSGIEVFLYKLLKNWPEPYQDEITVFSNQEFAPFLKDLPDFIKIRIIPFKKTGRLSFFLFQQLKLAKILKQEKYDFLFCASLLAPWNFKRKIISIHDAAPFVLKNENSLAGKLFWRLNLFFNRRSSLKIITVSEFSKRELIENLKFSPEDIEIIYNGSPAKNVSPTKKGNYLLVIGNARPRKNLERLLEAFFLMLEKKPDLKLIISGKCDERMEEIIGKTRKQTNENLKFTGFVSEEEKRKLMTEAAILVFPSLYEGFGIPIVEAGACGTPVACSDIPSFREIAGEAAIFFNPLDKNDIAEKILSLLDSPKKLQDLSELGKVNAARFDWQISAAKLAGIIHSYENTPDK